MKEKETKHRDVASKKDKERLISAYNNSKKEAEKIIKERKAREKKPLSTSPLSF